MPVKNRFAELLPEITAWRHDIHAHPELQFDTHRTSALVAEKLTEFGCDEVVTGIGRTGVVGVIKGKTNRSGKVIGLRADMDALPILEATGVAYASKSPGKMHACGHDGHTAMLLGAAKYLAETRNFDGTAVVIFQPAEESGAGGREMVEDGMMERFNIQEVYGMHTHAGLPVGQFMTRPGPILAAADEFFIEVEGKGGHAAQPHLCVDTTVVASQIVLTLQTITSLNVDPTKNAVVTVCTFSTDSTAINVVPQMAKLGGTVRTMDPQIQDLAEKRVIEIAVKTAETYGAVARVNYERGYPIVINTAEQTDFANEIATKISGGCELAPLNMGGEDFSYMLNARPGNFIFIGNGDTAYVHHPEYNFDDDAIPAGCSYWAEIIETGMPAA